MPGPRGEDSWRRFSTSPSRRPASAWAARAREMSGEKRRESSRRRTKAFQGRSLNRAPAPEEGDATRKRTRRREKTVPCPVRRSPET